MDEEGVLSILRGREGWDERYSSISEFKHHLNEASPLAEEEVPDGGWVFQNEYDSNNTKIITLLKHIASYSWFRLSVHHLVQFWAVVKVEGERRHHYLSTSNQPFYVGKLPTKGVSWYRKLCMVPEYAEQEAEQLGVVGRAYRNMHPESTPDLRLYSIEDFPLRDEAARCGFRGYLALPLFDLHHNQCYGVLELLSHEPPTNATFYALDSGQLKMAELRSTHVDFISLNSYRMPDKYKKPHAESEIREILEVAIKQVPRLSLAQVWVPCKQCANMSANLFCMEHASFINHQNKMINIYMDTDDHMLSYLEACEFHKLQINLNCLHPNLCDLTISKNPLAHYAVKARLSLCFTICLQSVTNSSDLYVTQFFLQPKCREDACGDSSLHLLLDIIEMKLRSFIIVLREQLPKELVVQSRQPNTIECESMDKLNVMNSFEEELSESNFTAYLETGDSCCLRPSFEYSDEEGWVFCGPAGEKLVEDDVKSNSLLVSISIKVKIEDFLKKISKKFERGYWIVQFWAPKMTKDRCYLETLDQPYAVGCLAKGIASFRKECIKQHYFVDEKTKEEELGPPGRVFRNGHPEITPDLFLYSTKEFSMRNYAIHCGFQGYFVLPVFEKLKSKSVGVLEFVGLTYCVELDDIGRALKAAKLHSIHSNFRPLFMAKQKPANIINCRKEALGEVRCAFDLIKKIPHLHKAKVWVPYDRCANVNGYSKCMELAFTKNTWEYMPTWDYMPTDDGLDWIYVEPKKGIIGMVLESENKSCFCQNLSEFSIVDQPLLHYQSRERVDVCFAICLQSSHTGDILYVLEFFLNPSPQYLQSFFSFLLPIMKHQLKSFKIASGKQLGEEFVVEVINFSEENQFTSSESNLPDIFPIKFKSVQYGQKEHPYPEEPQEQPVPYATETEQHNVNASNLKRTERGKGKTRLHLGPDGLRPHYGKKLKEVADELGVSRSTVKRRCKECGIDRWPNNKKQAMNPSLFVKESARDPHEQDISVHQNVLHMNMQSTRHQTLNSQDKYKDKNDNSPTNVNLFKRGEYDDAVAVDDDDIVQIIDDKNALRAKDVALTTGSTNASLPGPLKMLRSYAEHDLNDGRGILIVLDTNVFGNECKIYVHREDIIPFCDLEPISGNCIVVYIWLLYKKIKQENTIRRFEFVNPFAISHVPNSKPLRRAYVLADRLIATSPDQLVLVPCNIGKHWILTVVEPYKEVVSLLDPLNHCNCDESWKHEVNVAMGIFNTNLEKNSIERLTWNIIKVPRQPDLKQCGFYVMRYMKEIIQGLNTIDSSSLSSLFVKEEYSQIDINEVRIEWTHCLQEHA